MKHPVPAFIAIGSNIEPARNISHCLHLLREIPASTLVAVSSWYLTSPWGIESQPDFINLVVRLSTHLSPRALLEQTQAIETRLDRKRLLKNGPRTIDLDILLVGDLISYDSDLRIPHPSLTLRDFMLVPLIDVGGDVIHPERGCKLSDLTPEIRFSQILEQMPPGQEMQ
jgi:2-amino-4-hydroxy-6-hydroxymethyldihydropteridine diphosphokinase